jgi:hypothetical protein
MARRSFLDILPACDRVSVDPAIGVLPNPNASRTFLILDLIRLFCGDVAATG